ncbi:hypothetical protein QQ045_016252 [Rhodiola kirilowii]
MAVDVKVIRVYFWRLSVLFAGICFRFAQKHPCIFGTLLSLFVVYIFFPLMFRLLIYSSPIMICAYGYRKNVIKSGQAQIQKKYDCTNDVKSELSLRDKRHVDFSVQNVRTEVKEESKEFADYAPELNKKPLGALENEKLKKSDRESKSNILGKAENDSKKTKGEWGKAGNAETEDDDWRKSNGESESVILDKAEYDEDEETQEEDAQEEMQKVVEWTEQDERNLMDLGTSETERERRLESLIQKCRARKLLSMQVLNVIDIIRHRPNQVAPLVIARGTGSFNLINTLSETEDLHMPGSAPSVLLPSRSPFDLPYDPFEERHNLTGDSSFEQEFVMADQKDFCRHESFCLGGDFGLRQDGNSLDNFMNSEKKGTERNKFSRFRSYTDRGSYENTTGGALSLEHELMSCDDIALRDSGCEEQSLKQSDNVTSKLNAESENHKTENEEKCDSELLYANSCGKHATEGPVEADSAHSGNILCDTQVEVAKAELNQNMSSEDLCSYLHKSIGSSTQKIAVKELKENGHAQSPVYISSKDLFNVHKRPFHTPAHSIASDLVVEVSEAGSPPPTLSPPDGDSSQYDGDVDRDLSSENEDMSMHVYRMEEHGTRSSEGQESIPEAVELEQDVVDGYEHASATSTYDSSYENVVHHLTEQLKARRLSNKVIMETPQEPSHPAGMGSGVQLKSILSNQTNPMPGVNGGSSEQSDCGSSTTTDQCETSELSSPALAKSTTITSGKQFEQVTGLDIGTSGSRKLDEVDGDSGKQDYGIVEDVSLPVEEQGSSQLQVAEDVLGDTETISSDHGAMPSAQQTQAIEEVPEVTSPKSVLPDTDFRDQITRIDSQPSDLADSPSDVTPPENSTPSMADNQSSRHGENQDLRSSPSESIIEQGNKNNDRADYQKTESEAILNPSTSDYNSEALVMDKTDEDLGKVEVNQGIVDEKSCSAYKNEVTALLTGSEGGTAPAAKKTTNLELTEDETRPELTDDHGDTLVGLKSAEALPLSDILDADDEFNGLADRSPNFEGSFTAESSKQTVYNDTTNIGEPSSASATNIDASERNLDNTSSKSKRVTPRTTFPG